MGQNSEKNIRRWSRRKKKMFFGSGQGSSSVKRFLSRFIYQIRQKKELDTTFSQ